MPRTGIVNYTGNLEDTTMFKNMTDADLLAAITDLRISINNAANTRSARNMTWMLRQLDIAVAIKRQRGL